jgi:hypothetical protein
MIVDLIIFIGIREDKMKFREDKNYVLFQY